MRATFLTILAIFTFLSPAQAVSAEDVIKLIVSGFVPIFAADREIILNRGPIQILCKLDGPKLLDMSAPNMSVKKSSVWEAASKTHAPIGHNRFRIIGEFVDATSHCTVLSRAKSFRTNFELTKSGANL